MLDSTGPATSPAYLNNPHDTSTSSAGGVTMPERPDPAPCSEVFVDDLSRSLIASILAAGREEVVWRNGVEPSIVQLLDQKILQMQKGFHGQQDIVEGLLKRQWLDSARMPLVRDCLSEDSELSNSSLQALGALLHIAKERELLVDELFRRASSYGLEVPHEVSRNMYQLDEKGSSLFTSAVQRYESFLSSFEGPTCDELAKALLARCLRKQSAPAEPEDVNVFTTQRFRASRSQILVLSESARKTIFNSAIARGWMFPTDGWTVKCFLSAKPRIGWPIMHALNALCQEIRRRDELLCKIKQNGEPIHEGIERLKDVVSKAATDQFYRLVSSRTPPSTR
jgi:hypothetical protein